MKTSKYKVKLICGFRKEQEYTIDANEAHKAYYLFNHPEKRGTFNDGLAIKGADIQRIVPDYNAVMGWNPSHQLTSDDWNELHQSGVMQKLNNIMAGAKEIARIGNPQDFTIALIDLREKFPLISGQGSPFARQLLETKL